MRLGLFLTLALAAIGSAARGADNDAQQAITLYDQNGNPLGAITGTAVAREGEFSTVRLPDGQTIADLTAPTALPATEPQHQLGAAQSATVDVPGDRALLRRKLTGLDLLQTEIERLRKSTGTPASILVEVEMLEVSLTKMRKMGFEILTDEHGVIVGGRQPANGGEGAATYGQAPAPTALEEVESIPAVVKFFKENNIAKSLAKPSVLTTSSQRATIFVGDQYPFTNSSDGPTEVKYVEAGTRVDLTAVALGNNEIRLEVKPCITVANFERSASNQGQLVPAIQARECAFSCQATLGQTFAFSGLVQNRVESQRRWGRSVEKVNEIELWVVVRAEDASALGRDGNIRAASHVAPMK